VPLPRMTKDRWGVLADAVQRTCDAIGATVP
jgi:hypothetical protein